MQRVTQPWNSLEKLIFCWKDITKTKIKRWIHSETIETNNKQQWQTYFWRIKIGTQPILFLIQALKSTTICSFLHNKVELQVSQYTLWALIHWKFYLRQLHCILYSQNLWIAPEAGSKCYHNALIGHLEFFHFHNNELGNEIPAPENQRDNPRRKQELIIRKLHRKLSMALIQEMM